MTIYISIFTTYKWKISQTNR